MKLEHIQAFMHVLITCKYQKDGTINSREKVETLSSPLLVYGDFFRRSSTDNSIVGSQIWPKFEFVRYYACLRYKFKLDLFNSA